METYEDGPDQIVPATNYWTTKSEGYVKLKLPEENSEHVLEDEKKKPISVPGLLHKTAKEYPETIALSWKEGDNWKDITFREYEARVRICAKAFLKLGLQRHHTVCIIGHNSPEWFLSDLGAIFAGGIACGIYSTNSSEACFYCIEHCRANIIVAQDDKQIEKIIAIREKLPELKAVIQYEGKPTHPDVLSWEEVMKIGEAESDVNLDAVLKTIAVNECCTLVYTSGTVGNPKGVMLSHDNLTWNAHCVQQFLNLKSNNEETFISYLPLSHVAAQLVDIYLTITIAARVYFSDKFALKGSLINTLKECQPTRFLGVPRVWEKMYEKMREIGAENGYLKQMIATWAKGHGLHHHINLMNGVQTNTWGYTIASALVFTKIKQALGLNKAKLMASAAAPLAPEIKKYFLSIDIPVLEAFGMSECSGPHTLSSLDYYGINSIGVCPQGMKTKVINPNNENHGELCMYGRHIFMGYLGDEEKTKEAIDETGWLHSGDIGYVDERKMVYITSRLKELLITAGGENIPPVAIEQMVLNELPQISNAVLIGDRKKFLSMLVTLKTEVDPDTLSPLDVLTESTQKWLKTLGCDERTVSEVLNNEQSKKKVLEALYKGIEVVNKKATSNAQKIQKVAILPHDFSIPTGELGPTMKIKRDIVVRKYSKVIDSFYLGI